MSKITKLILTAVFVLLAVPALAQSKPAPIAEYWVFTPNNGESAEFWKAFEAHINVRKEAGDPWAWGVYTPLLGDQMGRVSVRYCCFEWADVDAYRAWNEENPDVAKHWSDNVAPHVAKTEHYFTELGWNNSNWNDGDYKYFGVTNFKLKPSAVAMFDTARDKMSQIALDNGWKGSWLWSTRVGGSPMESVVVPYTSFAEMQRDGESFFGFLARVLGSEDIAADILADFTEPVWGQDYQVWEYHPKFSTQRDD
jgi:hypothetical protein